MSSENEDQVLLKSPDENKPESQKVSKISYARDFLLSLSELDVCKKLPNGFDPSILSEFSDAPRNLRSEYAPVSHSRSDSSGSYMRVSEGRWETRSSGSNDKDGNFQSDQDSVVQDSGRRFGNQTRRGWQNSEHDGLLGSGAFPRPTGYAGSSAPKAQGNCHYQLNRSTEPYQPPRPYKAMPYSKKDYTDSHNDETFGSAECSSEDRAEEERKRRASFELMRKEQQKALRENHKQILDNRKGNLDSDIIALLGNSADVNGVSSENKSDDPVVISLSTSTSSLHIQAPASRPLVPPGFSSALVEKNLPVQSSSISLATEEPGQETIDCAVLGPAGHAISGDLNLLNKLEFVSDARYIIIVEKDAIFQRLAEDHIYNQFPCILITAKGYPDIATRFLLHRLSQSFPDMPILALVDWNPAGLAILCTYKFGSITMGLESYRYACNVKWLGLRGDDLQHVPQQSLMQLKSRDLQIAKSLISSDFLQESYKSELASMVEKGHRVDIEALYCHGYDFLGKYIATKIVRADYI